MSTCVVFYIVVFASCFILLSILDTIFKFYSEDKLLGRLIGTTIFVVLFIPIVFNSYYKGESLLKIEDHGVRWVQDDSETGKFSIGSELVLFITEDRQLHLVPEKDFQNIRFDSYKTNRIVSYERAVKVY
jgi:hypothetical protein